MTDLRIPRRTLAGSAAVLAAAGALTAIRAENGVEQASAATGPVPASTVPAAPPAAWTATPLATAASAGHKKKAKHKKAKHKKAKAKHHATPKPTTPAPVPATPTTPSTPITPTP